MALNPRGISFHDFDWPMKKIVFRAPMNFRGLSVYKELCEQKGEDLILQNNYEPFKKISRDGQNLSRDLIRPNLRCLRVITYLLP